MTDSEFVFLDTSPIIYLIENNLLYYSKVSLYLAKLIHENSNLTTSVISIAEFGVKPKRTNQLDLIEEMEEMLRIFEIKVINITRSIAEISSSIRAKYPAIKSFDALQLAAAIESKCTQFLTNDKALKAVREINVQLVEELS